MGRKNGLKRLLSENGFNEVWLFSNPSFESAFIGISHDNRAIYDYNLMVIDMVKKDGVSEDEAIEWIEYNTLRSLPYFTNSPIVMRSREDLF